MIDNSTCSKCFAGTYSFTWNSTKCIDCMDRATCLGGTEVYIEDKYWREDMNSSQVAR